MASQVKYYLRGVDLSSLGVHISSSRGIIGRPKPQERTSLQWAGYDGVEVDTERPRLSPRNIELNCFVEAGTRAQFMERINRLSALLDSGKLLELRIELKGTQEPIILIYYVYDSEGVNVQQDWDTQRAIGTFNLKLIEPEPTKRILEFKARANARTLTISATSSKYITIYWGDGSEPEHIIGTQSAQHTYDNHATYYPTITGDIDNITAFTANNTRTLWSKL